MSHVEFIKVIFISLRTAASSHVLSYVSVKFISFSLLKVLCQDLEL